MFNKKEYLDYSDVLILPKRTRYASRSEASLTRVYEGCNSKQYFVTSPIIISNLDTTGTIEVAKFVQKYNINVALHKFYTPTQISHSTGAFNSFVTVGINDLDWYEKIKRHSNPWINVDVANGYMVSFLEFIKKVRGSFPHHYIMAGNICSPEMVKLYYKAGADCVKVGIGSGQLCRTRVTAGIGAPQFTAIQNVAKEAKKYKMHVCADGGITQYADFAKALVAGADFVMAGSIFAGHDETSDEFYNNEKKYKIAYGMSSTKAMEKHYGQKNAYRASEGRVALIPYKGSIENTIEEILGSIRSTMSYTDTWGISNLRKAKWIKVNNTINKNLESQTIGI